MVVPRLIGLREIHDSFVYTKNTGKGEYMRRRGWLAPLLGVLVLFCGIGWFTYGLLHIGLMAICVAATRNIACGFNIAPREVYFAVGSVIGGACICLAGGLLVDQAIGHRQNQRKGVRQ